MVEAICHELELSKGYLGTNTLNTIYFGGGTPSLLSEKELNKIMDSIFRLYTVNEHAEVTLEANPDDLNFLKLQSLHRYKINRLSIGIQSFNDEFLSYLNRIHSRKQAEESVKMAQDVGLRNISIDLIYGIPAADHSIWEKDLAAAIGLGIQHISSYCLTIEPKTVFGYKLKKGNLNLADDDFAAHQFELLIATLEGNKFEQYEISNFCLENYHSRHNSNYWFNNPYLGIGPGAHSYNGLARQYNISNNPQYIQSIKKGIIPFQKEDLEEVDRFNEHILTRLRTKWGADLETLKSFDKVFNKKTQQELEKLLQLGLIDIKDGKITLTFKGKLLADEVTGKLFV